MNEARGQDDVEKRETIHLHPAGLGSDEHASTVRAEFIAEHDGRRTTVVVRCSGQEWHFERDRKGRLGRVGHTDEPTWVRRGLRKSELGRVAE